jgi:hypothetical protein
VASPLPARRLRLPGAALGPALVLLLVLALAGPVAHAQDRPLGQAHAARRARGPRRWLNGWSRRTRPGGRKSAPR